MTTAPPDPLTTVEQVRRLDPDAIRLMITELDRQRRVLMAALRLALVARRPPGGDLHE
ncbi:MAG TPA: hypothetical protein VM533_14075 [Fimbriiglobus sp.]|nr:hypothetical protein [Fimbriiglobus sp.]